MRTVRVEVTAQDIAAGVRCSSLCCPVVRAVTRQCPLGLVSVGKTFAAVYHRECPLPPVAREFISRFDAGLPVEPFAFDLEVP